MEIKVDTQGNPILDQFSEEGFVDCVLKITNLEESDSTYKFHMSGSHNGETVGMNVEVVKGIKGGFDSEMALIKDHVYREGVIFSRSGKESDRLLSALAELYGLQNEGLTMGARESYTGIALVQGEINMDQEPVKIKIFGKDSDENTEEEYNESFFNLDLANGFVFWNEKDQEYREALINGLSN